MSGVAGRREKGLFTNGSGHPFVELYVRLP